MAKPRRRYAHRRQEKAGDILVVVGFKWDKKEGLAGVHWKIASQQQSSIDAIFNILTP